MSKNRERGKRNERAISKLLEGKRIGVLGGVDISHPLFSIECKSREKLPKWLTKMWEQTKRNAEKEKIPILQIHQHGKKHLNDFIILKLKDFLSLLKSY